MTQRGAPADDAQYLTGTGLQDTRPIADQQLHFVPTYLLSGPHPRIAGSDPISQAVDDPGVANTYYLKLSKGETIHVYSVTAGNNKNVLLDVVSGNVVAFFTDLNHDGRYEDGELTGLALGANASVEVHGQIFGNVVTDLLADGTIHTPGDLVSNKQNISSLVVDGGSIFGDVLSGGNISKLQTTGVNNILAGNAASRRISRFFQIPDPLHPGQD